MAVLGEDSLATRALAIAHVACPGVRGGRYGAMSTGALGARFLRLLTAAALFALAAATEADAQDQTWLPRATIHPSLVRMEPGEQQWFKIVKQATRLDAAEWIQDVAWAVNGIPGGNAEIGTIVEDGTYTAPTKAPPHREVVICAAARGVANRYLWATVLFEAVGPPYALVNSWGERREDAEHFVDPHCIALDGNGNILIADYLGSRVSRFAPDGTFLGTIGDGAGEAPGKVTKPRVVTTDPNGLIFISDQKSDKPRIQVFSPEGRFLRIFAPKGTGPGHILRAHGMAFDADLNLYVVDVDNMRVNVYAHGGAFIRSWGRDGHQVDEFNAPHGLVVDPNGDVFICNYYATCQKFNKAGDFLFAFAHGDPPDGAVYIHSIAGDQWGNVYLMVRGARGYGGAIEERHDELPSVMKFNNNGDHVASITLQVSGHKENWATVDKDGNVYAVYESSEGFGVQIYEPR
jgi:sugar lactone lactonase YvrE